MKELKDVIHYYLPYGIDVKFKGYEIPSYLNTKDIYSVQMINIESGNVWLKDKSKSIGVSYDHVLPILRPLSDLTEEIDHNGKKFIPKNEIRKIVMEREGYSSYDASWLDYITSGKLEKTAFWVTIKLFEWHFDVFGLIESNQAIKK